MIFTRHFSTGLLLGCVAAGLAGCSQTVSPAPESSETRIERPVAVKTVSVIQQDVRQTSVQPATVLAFYSSDIQARVNGYIANVAVDIGDVVKAGDEVAKISVPELEKRRLIATARLERQHAEVERAAAGIELAEADVKAVAALAAEARSQMEKVDASLAAAEARFRRTEDLVERGSVQPSLLDEDRKLRDSELAAKSSVTSAIQSADANVIVAKAKAAAASADLKAKQAEVAVAEAQVAEIDELIKYSTIVAPFDGIVTERNVSPGDLVSDQNQKELFVISQTHKVRIHVSVPENDAAHVDRGDSIQLTFPSFPAEEAMAATVTRFSGSLDPGTRTMLIEAEIDNADGRLLPGMFGQASIVLKTKTEANVLPARAVRFSEDGKAFVYIVDNESISVASVVTGHDDGNTIEIVSGLEAGQKVIDAHLKRFTDGQRVRVLN